MNQDLALVRRSEFEDWGEPIDIWLCKSNNVFMVHLIFSYDTTIYTLSDSYREDPEIFTNPVDGVNVIRELKPNSHIKIKYR